jgi:exosortase
MSETTEKKTTPFPIKLTPFSLALVGVFAILVFLSFKQMWTFMYAIWFEADSYYSHGVLVPFLAGYLIWNRREAFEKIRINPTLWGLPLVILGLFGAIHGKRIDSQIIHQASFFAFLFGASLFILGKQMTKMLSVPYLFLLFMLPLPPFIFDAYTNQVQVMSSIMANKYLLLMQFATSMPTTSIIQMDHYILNIGIPCAGFKLSISLLTLSLFFIALYQLGWWKNLILLALLYPIAVLMNGLRIAMVGVVGELVWVQQGQESAMYWGQLTHDYSGYLFVFIAFLIFFGLARLLGWKQ